MAREESFFDDLARGLADGTITRAKALRLMGAALVGGTLASLGMGGEAAADPPGCKRNGKHCTRDTQCCSRNCVSGTCQAQTTTTTTSSTTSTSTSTTSSSTSTTSTTTTPMCLPNGGACSTSGDCCSGNCDSGFCVPAPTGTIRVDCFCTDQSKISLCTSIDCSDAARTEVCTPLCASHGGLDGIPGCFFEPACTPV